MTAKQKVRACLWFDDEAKAGGTHARMEHDGFGSGNAFAFGAMSRGWSLLLRSLRAWSAR